MKTLSGIKNKDKEIIVYEANAVDLTGELNVADISSMMDENYNLEGLAFFRRKPDILMEAFFRSIQLEKIQQLKSRFSLFQTKLGPHDLRKWIYRRNSKSKIIKTQWTWL